MDTKKLTDYIEKVFTERDPPLVFLLIIIPGVILDLSLRFLLFYFLTGGNSKATSGLVTVSIVLGILMGRSGTLSPLYWIYKIINKLI